MDNYSNMRVTELRVLAKECGLRDYSKLRKADLISLLRSYDRQDVSLHENISQKSSTDEQLIVFD